jgi:hypothetical protein
MITLATPSDGAQAVDQEALRVVGQLALVQARGGQVEPQDRVPEVSTLNTCGGSASAASRPSTRLTASRTSFAAPSISRASENSMEICDCPVWLDE